MHHPFTSPKEEDAHLLNEEPENVRANAYDLAINGVEVGGGSIRIHDRELQEKIFTTLGFTKEEALALTCAYVGNNPFASLAKKR